MLGFVSQKKEDERLISEERAREIIEAEIQRRGWTELPSQHYRIERRKGRSLWCYSGSDIRYVGRMMQIHVDAVTGELVTAAIAPR
jgi:hypothetical protein